MTGLVLWGHQLKDYSEMFDLQDEDWYGHLLEYGCGPSAVNAQLYERGKKCTSFDPLFCLDSKLLKTKTSLVFADMAEQIEKNASQFDFSAYAGLPGLIKQREEGMSQFFSDYNRGLKQKRYSCLQNIHLDFPDFYFNVAVSSHYFFAGLVDQDEMFHIQALTELARVATEVRIFPVIDKKGETSPLLGPILLHFQNLNYGTELRAVPYHLQKQGNAMLRIWAQECEIKK